MHEDPWSIAVCPLDCYTFSSCMKNTAYALWVLQQLNQVPTALWGCAQTNLDLLEVFQNLFHVPFHLL